MPREKSLGPAWQPGQSGNPSGRPIGNRNKLNEKFILALHDDFVQHGAKVIEQVRKDKPDIYLKVIAVSSNFSGHKAAPLGETAFNSITVH